jgi:hypothetical protein
VNIIYISCKATKKLQAESDFKTYPNSSHNS